MRTLLLFLAAVSLALPTRADFTFVHITDTHVSAASAEGNNADRDAAAFREISALDPKPAFVAHTGDVCETATPSEYAIYHRILKDLSIPIHVAPGNHDVRWNPLGKEGYRLGTNQPLYQSWDHENIHFVLLDPTVLLQHWGHFSKAQLDWLKADLEKVGKDKPVILGFHHWIGRDTVQVDNEQELLDLVAPYNVVLWLQGHGHADIQWNINGAPAIMAKGLYQGSYHLVEVTKDTLKVKRRTLGKPSGDEIVRDKSVPSTTNVHWTDVTTTPLKKPHPPNWSITTKLDPDTTLLTAAWSAPLTTSSTPPKLEYRLNGGKPAPMTSDDSNTYTARIPTSDLPPGEHVITVQLTLPDNRQYQKTLPLTLASSRSVTHTWSTNIGGAVQSHLVRTKDALYISTMGNDLVSLDPATGKENWRFRAEDALFSTPLIHENTAYVASADHHVYAIDTKSHQPRWKFKTNGAVLAGPALAKNTLCVGSVDQHIYGLDAATGHEKWKIKAENMFQSNTATDGTRFFVGGWDNTFRAIDADTGHVAWEKKIGRDPKTQKISFYYSPAISSPAVADGKVFVTTNDGVLHAFETTTGDEKWSFDNKKLGYSSPLVHEGKVFIAIGDEGKTFCLNAADGKLLWTSPNLPVIYDSSFTWSNGKVFIGSVNGTLNALDANTGAIAWQYHLGPGHVSASPTADHQNVYIASLSGKVTALPTK